GNLRRATGIPTDDLDLFSGHDIAVLLHVKLDAVVHLCRRIGELTGIGHDQADLDDLLCVSRNQSAYEPAKTCNCSSHDEPPSGRGANTVRAHAQINAF